MKPWTEDQIVNLQRHFHEAGLELFVSVTEMNVKVVIDACITGGIVNRANMINLIPQAIFDVGECSTYHYVDNNDMQRLCDVNWFIADVSTPRHLTVAAWNEDVIKSLYAKFGGGCNAYSDKKSHWQNYDEYPIRDVLLHLCEQGCNVNLTITINNIKFSTPGAHP